MWECQRVIVCQGCYQEAIAGSGQGSGQASLHRVQKSTRCVVRISVSY